jgi:predicted Zn finger-like uncharacterized protein
MIVSCPSCKTKYQFEESRFGDSTTKRLKCTKCDTAFDITKPVPEEGEVSRTAVVVAHGPESAAGGAAGREGPLSVEQASLAPLAALPPTKRYSLAVIMGANAGQIYTITKPRVVLGRGTESDVQLQDSEVSRRHAMLEIHLDEGLVSDLGSTNGTYVDGVRIQRATIYSNQEFSLGTTTVMFIVTDAHDGAVV